MESIEVAQQKKSDENPARLPPGLADKKSGAPKKRVREITSRFMSASISSSSSSVSGVASSVTKSQSQKTTHTSPQPGQRRQPSPHPSNRFDPRASVSEAPRRTLGPSSETLRSLSVSLQDEKFNNEHPLRPTAAANTLHKTGQGALEKKATVVAPLPGESGDQSENARPIENLQSRPNTGKPQGNPLIKSVNTITEKPVRVGQSRARTTPRPNPASRPVSGCLGDALMDSGAARLAPSIENLSSECASQARDAAGSSQEGGSQGSIVPARFCQETSIRARGIVDARSLMPEAELSFAISTRVRPTGGLGSGRLSRSSASPWVGSTNQSLPPPFPGPQPSMSPVKIIPSSSPPSRCLPSPTRPRGHPLPPTTATSQIIRSSGVGSLLNFIADGRKGKKGPSPEDVHLFRLLHNRHLQWRFVNTKAEAVMNAQRVAAEKMLYSAWIRISELQDSVIMKRIELHKAMHANKLRSVLSEQKAYLEDWALLEQDHCSTISGAIKDLEAATLRIPITDGVKADIREVKEALNSAVNVIGPMSSTICSLLPKVEDMSNLVLELAAVAAQERGLLDECKDLIATTGALEVEESSLRTNLIQLKREKCRGIG